MLVRAAQPYVKVANMEESLAFFQNVLHYEVVERLEANGKVFWASLRNGPSLIMISSRPVHDRHRLTWLYVEDVDNAYAEMVQSGFVPISEPTDQQHGTREFIVEDPDGNPFVVSQPIKRQE